VERTPLGEGFGQPRPPRQRWRFVENLQNPNTKEVDLPCREWVELLVLDADDQRVIEFVDALDELPGELQPRLDETRRRRVCEGIRREGLEPDGLEKLNAREERAE
jgi:hypothetical protein